MIRQILPKDINALFDVRVLTKENKITVEELNQLGITPKYLESELNSTINGWLFEEKGEIKGFAMGNRANGEMMVIALLPEAENRGIGGQLLRNIENWLFENGWKEIWLTTEIDPELRAYGFYRHNGWEDREIKNNARTMVKRDS